MPATITASLFAINRVGGGGGDGGALLDFSNTGQTNTISGSTFYSNRAILTGGALRLGGNAKVNVTNSTFFGNFAGDDGGAIAVFSTTATLNLSHVTIAGNWARNAGGIYLTIKAVNISNMIIANNTAGNARNTPGNCIFFSGTVSGTNNLEDAGPSCGTSFATGNPMLGPPTYNDGPLAGAPEATRPRAASR